MLSPIDHKTGLETVEVEPRLSAMRCPASGGMWLRPSAFWKWRESRDAEPVMQDEAPSADSGTDLPAPQDSPAGKRCPEDGHFLIRHRVGHGLDFHLDRCARCGGMWFDRHEWDALTRHGLSKDLHLIFTSAWQAEVRRQHARQSHEARLVEQFGEDTFRRLREVRAWLDAHAHRRELVSYLLGENDL